MVQKSITSYFKSTSSSNSNINLIFGEKKEDLIIYTDGACSNNGKSTAKAGIGVYSKDKLNISERIVGKQTNCTPVRQLFFIKFHISIFWAFIFVVSNRN